MRSRQMGGTQPLRSHSAGFPQARWPDRLVQPAPFVHELHPRGKGCGCRLG